MLSSAVVTCTIWASVGGRLSAAAATLAPHGTDAGKDSRGGPMAWRHPRNSFPSHTQTGPAPPHARTPRARAGVRVAAARARHAGAGPHAGRGPHGVAARRGRLAGRRMGGRAGGRCGRARGEGLSEFDSRRAYSTRNPCAHLRQSLPSPLPASRLEGGSTSAGVGGRRALGMVAAIWGRRGMVWAALRLSTKLFKDDSQPSQNYLRIRGRGKSG